MTFDRRLSGRRKYCLAAGLSAFVVFVGCGTGDVPRFDVSGTVTYNGNPVPVGYMVFGSDTAAGNLGPASQADIRDGKYATKPGFGTIGGPHVVSIFGFDGTPYKIADDVDGPPMLNPMGKPLFASVTISVDLPMETAVHDFKIPKQ